MLCQCQPCTIYCFNVTLRLYHSPQGFETGSVRQFILGVPRPLGSLIGVGVWHDNSGDGDLASWFLHKMEFIDLQNSRRHCACFVFQPLNVYFFYENICLCLVYLRDEFQCFSKHISIFIYTELGLGTRLNAS